MNLIAAVDKNWAIGCKNKLLVSIPADMKFSVRRQPGKWSSWEEKRWRVFQTDSLSKKE